MKGDWFRAWILFNRHFSLIVLITKGNGLNDYKNCKIGRREIYYPTHTYRIFLKTFSNKAQLSWIANFFPAFLFALIQDQVKYVDLNR